MSLADALEDERRETAESESHSVGRRGLSDQRAPARNALDVPSTPGQQTSKERWSNPFAAGNANSAQSGLGGKMRKQSASAEAMAAIFGGAPKDFKVSSRTRGSGRHNSTAGIGNQSRSPSTRIHRASSPGMGLLINNRSSPMHIMTDSSFNDYDDDDDDYGHDKSSSSNLASKAMSSYSATKNIGEQDRHDDADSGNDSRLEKDHAGGEDADEGAIESSEDEDEAKSSEEDEEATPDRKRGRRRSRAEKESDTSRIDSEESDDDPYASLYGQNKSTRQAKSALAAAEDDRESVEPLPTLLIADTNRHGSVEGKDEVVRALNFHHWAWR